VLRKDYAARKKSIEKTVKSIRIQKSLVNKFQ
jgi:hypothetical protein